MEFPKKLYVIADEEVDADETEKIYFASDNEDEIPEGEEYAVYTLDKTKEKQVKRGKMPRENLDD